MKKNTSKTNHGYNIKVWYKIDGYIHEHITNFYASESEIECNGGYAEMATRRIAEETNNPTFAITLNRITRTLIAW